MPALPLFSVGGKKKTSGVSVRVKADQSPPPTMSSQTQARPANQPC